MCNAWSSSAACWSHLTTWRDQRSIIDVTNLSHRQTDGQTERHSATANTMLMHSTAHPYFIPLRRCVDIKSFSPIPQSFLCLPDCLHESWTCTELNGHSHLLVLVSSFSIFTARCTLVQSAVLRSHVVCLSVCDVGGLWSHRLEFFENNFTIS